MAKKTPDSSPVTVPDPGAIVTEAKLLDLLNLAQEFREKLDSFKLEVNARLEAIEARLEELGIPRTMVAEMPEADKVTLNDLRVRMKKLEKQLGIKR